MHLLNSNGSLGDEGDKIDVHVSLLLANVPLCDAIRDSGSCLRTTEDLQLTPNELRLRLIHVLKNNPTLSSNDRGHAICVLEMSFWFCGWVPSNDLSCARYPLLPLEMSADAPPLASQLPPGCGRLYFFISELENTGAPMRKVMTDGSGGIITISIPLLSVPLLGVMRKIPFLKILTTADVLKLCCGAFSVGVPIHFSIERASEEHLSTATVSETPPSSNQVACWTGDVSVHAELSCVDCGSNFEVRHTFSRTDCHTCDNKLFDESFFWCLCCERVICVQCMDSTIYVQSSLSDLMN